MAYPGATTFPGAATFPGVSSLTPTALYRIEFIENNTTFLNMIEAITTSIECIEDKPTTTLETVGQVTTTMVISDGSI